MNKFKAEMTLENAKIMVFTDIVNDYNLQIEDLPLFEKVLRSIRDGVYVERLPFFEDLENVKSEIDGI